MKDLIVYVSSLVIPGGDDELGKESVSLFDRSAPLYYSSYVRHLNGEHFSHYHLFSLNCVHYIQEDCVDHVNILG